MADNIDITPGTGATVRTDELAGGEQIQVVKIALGADGAEDNLVDSGQQLMAASVPVVLASNHSDIKITLDSEAVVLGAGSANVGDVDVASVPAPLSVVGGGTEAAAMRVTLANDSTGVLSVDDGGGALTVDAAHLDIRHLNATDDLVKLGANTGVDIGDVDVLSIAAGDNNIGNVDIATVPAPLNLTGGGVELSALRVTLASDSTGLLSVDDNGGTLTVDNAVLSVVGNGAAATALRVTLANDSTGVVQLAAGTAGIGKLTANSGVDIGDVDVLTVPAPLSTTGNGTAATALRVSVASDSTGQVKLAASDGVDIGNVDVASVVPGAGATNLGKAEDAAHSSGDVGVMALAIRDDTLGPTSSAENDYEPLHTDALGALWTHPMGDVAHDSADSGNPLKVGGKAVNAEPTAVAANDRANLITDLVGKLINLPYANPENHVSGATAAITDTTHTSVIAAAGNGVRNYITSILVTNSHATVGTVVQITDGSGGTVLWQGFAAALGGGFACTFPVPLKTTANTALYCECVTTGSNVYVCAAGYKGV